LLAANRDKVQRELQEELDIHYEDLPLKVDYITDGQILIINKAIYRENNYTTRELGQIFNELSQNVVILAIPKDDLITH